MQTDIRTQRTAHGYADSHIHTHNTHGYTHRHTATATAVCYYYCCFNYNNLLDAGLPLLMMGRSICGGGAGSRTRRRARTDTRTHGLSIAHRIDTLLFLLTAQFVRWRYTHTRAG